MCYLLTPTDSASFPLCTLWSKKATQGVFPSLWFCVLCFWNSYCTQPCLSVLWLAMCLKGKVKKKAVILSKGEGHWQKCTVHSVGPYQSTYNCGMVVRMTWRWQVLSEPSVLVRTQDLNLRKPHWNQEKGTEFALLYLQTEVEKELRLGL